MSNVHERSRATTRALRGNSDETRILPRKVDFGKPLFVLIMALTVTGLAWQAGFYRPSDLEPALKPLQVNGAAGDHTLVNVVRVSSRTSTKKQS